MDKPTPRSLTDQQLASFLGNRPDLIIFFRTFIRFLTEQLPDAVDSNTELIEAAQESADSAGAVAALAQAMADAALQLARQATEGPPVIVLPTAEPPDDLTHVINAMRGELQALARRVSDIEERPTP